ncbi:hypothetical protein INR49_010146 [Caranx melampygus]|nr:hypothetical protein INR49_010146 [Caranx melampygus]
MWKKLSDLNCLTITFERSFSQLNCFLITCCPQQPASIYWKCLNTNTVNTQFHRNRIFGHDFDRS